MNYSRIVLWVLIALSVVNPIHAQITTHWKLYENQLDIERGGQVNSVAVSPFDSHVMFAATESGGLFKTTSAGAHWAHADKLPVNLTQSVAFVPTDPFSRVILVSAKEDYKTENGGGVWRSADGGSTWTQTLKDLPDQERMSAYEISARPGTDLVFVGTSVGAFVSFNGGLNWTPAEVFNGVNKAVFSVMATEGRIFFGGPAGVRTANANLIIEGQTNANPIHSMHAFGRRGTTQHVFFVDDERRLHVGLDGGGAGDWIPIQNAPEGTGKCTGTPFIKAVDHGAGLPVDLYYSNRCTLQKLVTPLFQDGLPNYFIDDWHQVQIDHGRPRDLALVGITPLLLASTAGVHDQAANEWHLIGGGREGGLNALQINEVKGQIVPGQLHPDLYVGTNENGLWSANVSGDIVSPGGHLNPPAPDGHFIELKPSISGGEDSRITFHTGIRNKQSERNLFNVDPWLDAPGGRRQAPVLLEPCRYVQNHAASLLIRKPGMAITEDCGDNWDQFAEFREQTTDIPKAGQVNPSLTIIYQSIKRSSDPAGSLMQLIKVAGFNASVGFPAMALVDGGINVGVVGLGINATGFGGYRVYSVDPASPAHVIAPDVVNERMAQTRNGAGTWTVMGDLTDQVSTGNGRLFNSDLGGSPAGKVFPIVSAISFFPSSSQFVLAGTVEGGIFVSSDNGGTWSLIAGSDKATSVTGFFWESLNTAYVSTYGRGLWKLKVRAVAPVGDFDALCSRCDVVAMDPGRERPRFDRSALVFNGQMLAVRTNNQKLSEVFVTPGSSVVFTGDPNDPMDDIAITESDGRDPQEPLPQPKDGIVSGVVLTSDNKLVGAVFAPSQMTLPQPKPDPIDDKVSTESPTAGRPYITLNTSGSAAVPTVEPEELFDLSATDFPAGKSYEVLVDGTPLKGEITADSTGCFDIRITAPSDAGYHRLTVRMSGDEQVLDASTLFVRMEN